ncbi:MAG: methylamine---glutamate N-methyltransferase subunit [Clostridiales bacterium]|jgi:glutamine phosphoribosylpyrophosphate amidotransferase|nr:methylamine---glutamate N-methyltransferase subunit [Clostridiales bacterium]MDN5298898.1 methylamine---glutamate N-methyltransferase subunit [Clostridiales bacterium]
MCGIAGIISKNETDISKDLLKMLTYIQHRGPDASGIAVFPKTERICLRVSLKEMALYEKLIEIIKCYGEIVSEKVVEAKSTIPIVEFELAMADKEVEALHTAINANSGITVHSVGNGIKVYKEGGYLDELLSKHTIDHTPCRHGIGHVRMATESAEDINAAHPFVSPFYPGLAMVHNGQFTNYFKLRRFLESKGATFKTMNDSEAASHLIAYAMRENGGDLEAALKYASENMDGIYCIIASTENQIGFVKDQLGIKPLLVVEADDYILLGSEQIEFNIMDEEVFAVEMEPGEVRVWDI